MLKREHAIFVDDYVVHRNASRAARAAGYKSPRNTGSRLSGYRRSKRKLSAAPKPTWPNSILIGSGCSRIVEEIQRAQASGTKSQTALKGLELLSRHMGMFMERQEIMIETAMLENLAEEWRRGKRESQSRKTRRKLFSETRATLGG